MTSRIAVWGMLQVLSPEKNQSHCWRLFLKQPFKVSGNCSKHVSQTEKHLFKKMCNSESLWSLSHDTLPYQHPSYHTSHVWPRRQASLFIYLPVWHCGFIFGGASVISPRFIFQKLCFLGKHCQEDQSPFPNPISIGKTEAWLSAWEVEKVGSQMPLFQLIHRVKG